MPNLLKVGRTTRPPEERVRELNVTAVPTPFVLAYKAFFSDCVFAEQFVHTYLETKGYRVSQQREFFTAPLNMVVDAVIAAQEQFQQNDGPPQEYGQSCGSGQSLGSQPEGSTVWTAVLREADNFRYGFGGEVEDKRQAYRMLVQAAKLGAPEAYVSLAEMHLSGEGVTESIDEALGWLRKGAELGHRWCWVKLADVYLSELNQPDNARKCLRRFFANPDVSALDDDQERRFFFELKGYCRLANPQQFDFAQDSAIIQGAAEALLKRISLSPDPTVRDNKSASVSELLRTCNKTLP